MQFSSRSADDVARSWVRTEIPLGDQQASLQPGPTCAAPPIFPGTPTQLHPYLHQRADLNCNQVEYLAANLISSIVHLSSIVSTATSLVLPSLCA